MNLELNIFFTKIVILRKDSFCVFSQYNIRNVECTFNCIMCM